MNHLFSIGALGVAACNRFIVGNNAMAERNGFETDADAAELSLFARRLVGCLFTPAAEYVTGAGERIRGREAISALLDRVAAAAQVTAQQRAWRRRGITTLARHHASA